jgi:uncharacterized protein HemX
MSNELYFALWIVLTALASGGLTYWVMKRKMRKTDDLLASQKKQMLDYVKNMEKQDKLAQLEISARDKKISALKSQIASLQENNDKKE